MGCHLFVTAHPIEHMQWMQEKLGPYRFAALTERANDLSRGRQVKRELKDVAKHFKLELERLQAGATDFAGYL